MKRSVEEKINHEQSMWVANIEIWQWNDDDSTVVDTYVYSNDKNVFGSTYSATRITSVAVDMVYKARTIECLTSKSHWIRECRKYMIRKGYVHS